MGQERCIYGPFSQNCQILILNFFNFFFLLFWFVFMSLKRLSKNILLQLQLLILINLFKQIYLYIKIFEKGKFVQNLKTKFNSDLNWLQEKILLFYRLQLCWKLSKYLKSSGWIHTTELTFSVLLIRWAYKFKYLISNFCGAIWKTLYIFLLLHP